MKNIFLEVFKRNEDELKHANKGLSFITYLKRSFIIVFFLIGLCNVYVFITGGDVERLLPYNIFLIFFTIGFLPSYSLDKSGANK